MGNRELLKLLRRESSESLQKRFYDLNDNFILPPERRALTLPLGAKKPQMRRGILKVLKERS